MTYLLSKFTNRALSKTVAFGDGVFSIADFLRDPGERRDGVRTGGGGPSHSPPGPWHQPGCCDVGDSRGATPAGDRGASTSSPRAWSSAAPFGPYLPGKAPASSPRGAPRFRSFGMLVGISQVMLPKPITCVSIVLIVAFKIITGWRERTGRALWICTGARARCFERYGRFAAQQCFTCSGERFGCRKEGWTAGPRSLRLEQLEQGVPLAPHSACPGGEHPSAPGLAGADSCSFKPQLFPPCRALSGGNARLK